MGFKGVQPLQRVNQSNLLAVLTVMSNILETSQIRDGLGCDDDYSGYELLYYYAMDTDLVIANLNYFKSNQLKATARFASPPYASPPCQRGHLLSTCWSTHPCFPFSTLLCWMESNRCSGYKDEEDYT